LGAVLGRVGDVYAVGDPVDDVDVVGREVEVDELLVLLGRIELVEDAGRAGEAGLHVLAGDDHGAGGVGGEAEVGDVLDASRAGGPVLHVLAGDDHGLDGVGIGVEVGDVLDRHRADGDVGVVVRAATTAGLKRGGGGEQRQALPLGALQHLAQVRGLGDVDDL